MSQESSLQSRALEISELLSKRTHSKQEGRILELMRPLEPTALAGLLHELDLVRLVKALDNRRWGPDSRKEFLRLLAPAQEQLELESKASIIRALAEEVTDLSAEQAIGELFKSESGEKLTELKLLVDCANNGHDLLHILYSDIDSADIRFDILTHFQKSKPELSPESPRPLRVVSDIDDTLYASLNDPRYKKGTVYPGVLELIAALSPLPPVFLTARPELAASLFERITHKQLAHYGVKRCTVLSGSLPGLFGHRRMAEQKARTLLSFRELYPELRFLFIGDSGQGDYALSESLLKRKDRPIECALIHKLADNQPGSISKHRKIYIFQDYGEAAQILGGLGFLQSEQVDQVQASLG